MKSNGSRVALLSGSILVYSDTSIYISTRQLSLPRLRIVMSRSRSTLAIFDSFLSGKSNSNYNSLSTNGTCLWSYSTPIAYRVGNTIIVSTRKYSRTTSRQQGLLGTSIDWAVRENPSIKVIETDDVVLKYVLLTHKG